MEMETDSWYRKIMDMMIRVSHLYGLCECFFTRNDNSFSFRYESNDIIYFVSFDTCFADEQLHSLLNAFAKGLNLTLVPCNGKISCNDTIVGNINEGSFDLSLNSLIMEIASQKRNLSNKPFAHLYMIVQDKSLIEKALRAINVCRLGGLISYFDYSNAIENSVLRAEKLNSLFIVNVCGENTVILNTQTGNEEEININEIYPYIISYVKGKSKCSSCKDKEE